MIQGEVRKATHIIVLALIVAALIILAVYWHRRQKRMMASAGLNGVDAETLAEMPPGGTVPANPGPEGEEQPSRAPRKDRSVTEVPATDP